MIETSRLISQLDCTFPPRNEGAPPPPLSLDPSFYKKLFKDWGCSHNDKEEPNNWEDRLTQWVNRASPEERNEKERIAQEIRNCHAQRKLFLKLSTNLSSLSGVAFPTGLEWLKLSHCTNLTSLSGVAFPTGLRQLYLSGCTNLSSLSGVDFPTGLEWLELSDCTNLSSLSGVTFPTGLEWLELSHCTNLSSLSGVAFPTGLERLILSDCTNLSSLSGVVFPTGLKTLNLSICTNLSSLSDIVFPTGLEELILPRCTNLSSLSGIVFPTELKTLNLSHCTNLTSLSGIVFPTKLQRLDLSYCTNLSSLSDIVFPTGLQWLDLSECTNLSSLSNIVFPRGLQGLNLSYCNGMRALPDNLAALSSSCTLNTQFCGLSSAESRRFQNLIIDRRRSSFGEQGPRWLTNIVALHNNNAMSWDQIISRYTTEWKGHYPDVPISLPDFSQDNKKQLLRFFNKLFESADFKNEAARPGVLWTLHEALKAAKTNKTFHDNLISLIVEANESCADRTTITLNRIDIQRRIDTESVDLQFYIGLRHLQLLHEKAIDIINKKGLGDPIEPMLYLQNKLRNELHLPIVSRDMRYAGMAHISADDLQSVKDAVLEQTKPPFSFLTQWDIEYTETGAIRSQGGLSPKNPFAFDIAKLWANLLEKTYPMEFRNIEPSEEEVIANPQATLWAGRKARLIQKLTEMELCKLGRF